MCITSNLSYFMFKKCVWALARKNRNVVDFARNGRRVETEVEGTRGK